MNKANFLLEKIISTPLGEMRALASQTALHVLDFVETKSHQRVSRHRIIPGESTILSLIESELDAYFQGRLHDFQTPIMLQGTPFQIGVWAQLRQIPYGTTKSYAMQARAMGRAKAYRAVAQANAANPLALIVPCHRVIQTNGALGGYAGQVYRKKWLLEHEKCYLNKSEAILLGHE